MPIRFIPNDPLAGAPPERVQDARANRPAARAGFTFSGAVPEGVHNVGTAGFLFWQCREAALAAVETWEALDGNLAEWANGVKNLELNQDHDDPEIVDAQKLNAFYDGLGLRFFQFDDGSKVSSSGASVDTVAHEAGHALLDVVRPEFFQSFLPEVNAFHESFGDCVAILTALRDEATRAAVLAASPDLGAANFVEATSEDLSDGIRRQFGEVAPSLPRRALNDFQWALPSTLAAGTFQDPPALLTAEVHSFSRVFTGCFYDALRNIFTAQARQDADALLAAAATTGRLLIAAIRATPETARYFRDIGRAMVLVDEQQNAGANRQAIRDAFEGHGIALGSAAMLAPTAALAGAAPKVAAAAVSLAAATVRDIKERIRAAPGARLAVSAVNLFGESVVEAVHRRQVDLGPVHKALEGVVCFANELVLVGASGARAAVLGGLPEANRTIDEVSAFVETLVRNNRIAAPRTRGAVAASGTATGRARPKEPTTHVIKAQGGKKVLTRTRFLCRC